MQISLFDAEKGRRKKIFLTFSPQNFLTCYILLQEKVVNMCSISQA